MLERGEKMISFLTEKLAKKFTHLSLDYVYKTPLLFMGEEKNHIFSTSNKNHYDILLDFMEFECIPYDEIAYNLLRNLATEKGIFRMAELGDMVFQGLIYQSVFFGSLFYCPRELTEYQRLRLRLWYEFIKSIDGLLEIVSPEKSKTLKEKEEIETFLEERKILDDTYIFNLTKKYPNYQED